MEDSAIVTIFFSNTTGIYNPGQIIAGRIVVSTIVEEEIRSVVIKLEGKATVSWTKGKDGNNNSDEEDEEFEPTQRNEKHIEKSITYLDMKNYYRLGGGGESGVKLRGETSYAFTFQLPPKHKIPGTFKGKFGRIHYFVKATVQRSYWKIDYEVRKSIHLNAIFDLNEDPEAALPGEWTMSKRFGILCCTGKPLNVKVCMDRRGYCPGEMIKAHVNVENLSGRKVNNLTAKFVQETTYKSDEKEKKFCRVLSTRKWGDFIDSGDNGLWIAEVEVPNNVPPTGLGGCKIIDVKYFLKVQAHVFGVAFNVKQDCQVIIGTIPLRMKRDDVTSSTFVAAAEGVEGASVLEVKNSGLYPDLVPLQQNEPASQSDEIVEEVIEYD